VSASSKHLGQMGATCSRPGGINSILMHDARSAQTQALPPFDKRGRPDAADSRARHDWAEAHIKRRATASLLAGTVFGVMAVGYLIYLAAVVKSEESALNMYGRPFPSGKDYVFSGASEMISTANGSHGRVYFGLVLVSTFLTIISWYPYELSNVHVGDETRCIPGCDCLPGWMLFPTARSLVCPLGLLLISSAHVVADNVSNTGQAESVLAQMGGAVLLIGGYIYFELYTLFCARITEFAPCERCARLLLLLVVAVSGACFFAAPMVSQNMDPCCGDVYWPVNMTVVHEAQANSAYVIAAQNLQLMQHKVAHPDAPYPFYLGLYDTAKETGRQVKLMRFWGELIAILGVVTGNLVVWYCCPERHVQNPKYVPQDAEGGPTSPSAYLANWRQGVE